MKRIQVGWAQTSITPDRPVYNVGQIYSRVSQYVHDPITATALALENGEAQAVLVSMDMVGAPCEAVMRVVRENAAKLDGLNPEMISVSVTHTHNSLGIDDSLWGEQELALLGENVRPLLDEPDNILKGEEMIAYLAERLSELVERAWTERKPGAVSGASDYAAVAFNRRPVFEKDGVSQTQMYGVCARDDFMRYEGASDHSAEMLYTWDEANRLTGVLVCIPCPSQVFELHDFITADYWGYARAAIRERLGEIFVLPLCGSAGDQNPLDLTRLSKTNRKALEAWGAQAGPVFRNFDMAEECRGIAERIAEAVSRGHRKARNSIDPNPILRHERFTLKLPLRKVSEADCEEAKAELKRMLAPFSAEHRMTGKDLVAAFEPMGVVTRWREQHEIDGVEVCVHALRVGGAALVTNPFELFCEYGFRIKARAKSLQTIVVQLSNGEAGYLPTKAAIAGGSYSSKPASTMCDSEGGDALVEAQLKAIERLFPD